MIGAFESMVRQHPDRTCFTYVDKEGEESSFSYRETRMISAAIARTFFEYGAKPGDAIVVDLPNTPEYVFLILAAAFGGYTLIALNNRLTASEKRSRIADVERKTNIKVVARIDMGNVSKLSEYVLISLSGEGTSGARFASHTEQTLLSLRMAASSARPRSPQALGRAAPGQEARRRASMARQDALEGVIHFAEHAARTFDSASRAIIMFTSGTTGCAKAVPLTWDNICCSARISNASLNCYGKGLWQATLPLYHIGGFQIVVRSLLNANGFILYGRFDADRVLKDAQRHGATHVSVVDKMLQDMIASPHADVLKCYEGILLGGGALNPQTLKRACGLGGRIYASYGMTETSSQIAHTLVTPQFKGGLRLLCGYEACIVDPNEEGFGRLAVKGPGLFKGYLNARATYTADNYFLTGDTAALWGDCLYIKERTKDMFVSGGENIYPAEIAKTLLDISQISDAHVFGAFDKVWGRRPVAFVERMQLACTTTQKECSNAAFALAVRKNLTQRLSKIYMPKHLFVLDEFPRTGIGKINREALERDYEQRIEVVKVILYRIRLPFKRPFKTPKGTLCDRESIIVEVVDGAGRTGIGECVAFSSDWYLPETLDEDEEALRNIFAPLVLHHAFLHPKDVSELFAVAPQAALFPMAAAALEPALWDLYGKIVGQPMWQLIGGVADDTLSATKNIARVPAAAVVGLESTEDTLQAVYQCVEEGYQRVKLKVVPDTMLERVSAVRRAFSGLVITLDANQSFTEHDMQKLRALDAYDIAWIEEPLDPNRSSPVTSGDIFERLARLQNVMNTPICLDESLVVPDDFARALSHPELRCYAIKIGKFGGVQPALTFMRQAHEQGIQMWMGGMYDTGVSKRLHAAFETLDFVQAPGDIGSTARYFPYEITDSVYVARQGMVTLNCAGHEYGLGCSLDHEVLSRVLLRRTTLE